MPIMTAGALRKAATAASPAASPAPLTTPESKVIARAMDANAVRSPMALLIVLR